MFTLDQVVPWGRSFDEYARMFLMQDGDLASRVLGCGDGPASFNAEATRHGMNVISCDPIYRWTRGDLERRIAETYDQVLEQARLNAGQFVWDAIPSVEHLGRVRMAAMREFLEDYDQGKAERRYLDAELPTLPFPDASFDLALCSHLLFLYSAQLDEAFHRAAVLELARVSREVRIFPLLALDGKRSPHVDAAIAALVAAGCEVSIAEVPYEFQRGGNQMMRVRRAGG
jgi:SAM-dependent methyltransferase